MPGKLWLFGDSFTSQAINNSEQCWPNLLATKLGISEYENFAECGVSNDWIFYMLTSNINNLEVDDFVVVQTTQKHRQWFFENQPTIANYWIKDFSKFVTAEQSLAVDKYVEHLQTDKLDDVRWVQFSLALERLAQLLPVNMLVLPGFNSVNGVIGTLVDTSENEFVTANGAQKYFDNNDGKDPRNNHLSTENHQILVDKIFKFFNAGEMIDLTTDFKKSFLE
jgi:hypothetical protein